MFVTLRDGEIYTVSQKNPCDDVFCDNLNKKCPIVIIFGTVIIQSISHRKVVSVSHFTYCAQLPYPGNLLNVKIANFDQYSCFPCQKFV